MFNEMNRAKRISRFAPALCLLLVLIILAAASAFAHDPGLSAAELNFDSGQLVAQITFSRAEIAMIAPMDADRDGQITQPEFDAARAQLESLARESFALNVDGNEITATALSVKLGDGDAIHFDLQFPAPQGSKLVVRSSLFDQLARGHRQFLSLRGADGGVFAERMLDATNNSFECDLAAIVASHTRWGRFREFSLLGIEHILLGFDHLAFLLALLIAGGTLREAVKVITSFTVAHSITLAMATLNVVNIPPGVVEPLIAVSIIYVGLENIFRREIKRRWLLTFAFGLIHGFGFASALGELGIGADSGAVVPLLSFNLGVEVGQIAIAALALPLIWKLRQQPQFVVRYIPACSILIALAGGYWLIERTMLR
ncbi:MAG: HupE/UreJ family protein [Blastocatellia bacterium]